MTRSPHRTDCVRNHRRGDLGQILGIIAPRLRNAHQGPEEALLPVLDGKGRVVAYERHMAPKALAVLERNTHTGEMLGS